jgi:hypothetical protein
MKVIPMFLIIVLTGCNGHEQQPGTEANKDTVIASDTPIEEKKKLKQELKNQAL